MAEGGLVIECLCSDGVRAETSGAPAYQVVCHCDSCRRATRSPLVEIALFAPDQVRVVRGAELLSNGHATAG
eukprot:CAMPEP_0198315836 /NCGR_PEP_ID=MMETSP1450-20131203/5953_1 /TAXON_ID=753684 ORGANISM="Madagascaria erythrocladiodes, Strain CCMP3234" /NCGR_SAMPLE_ID=MMETSP1450 /ASSEMBLY_ACC=CAM_ASM_001115 /LENGTH=71 /DNA_ID=CAMNT_0044018961 /DNA_START=59 /DNA_END=270 /DNA_ORIENTATION=+